ncbi:MAG TPA: M23 family metallopeptidase [Methyloceanibacter sp.]|nr:M23 family metallopeptidase [Methyloceanibacter sp.]
MPLGLRCHCLLVFALALGLSPLAQPLLAAAIQPEDVVSPLVVMPLTSPNPVLGADDKLHLAYEIVLVNMAPGDIGLKKVETLDAASAAVLGTMEGDGLAQMLNFNGGNKGTTLSGAGSGILFMDVTLAKDASVPKAIRNRFDINVAKTAPAQGSGDHDPAPEPPQAIVFTGGPLAVGPAAVVIAPPLKGSNWVAGGGCCAPPSYHRGATLPINGAMHVAERFAIDFVQLNDKNMLIVGPMEKRSSYAYFGDEIYSVADGTVVGTADGLKEQVPGKLPADATIHMAAGNRVVVDIGEGRFAFYAHMQPGSVRVKVGDKVKTGQVLGLLGNSGNTDTPHLHFHVMDGPSPLVSNGLPYVFTGFTGQGRVTDEQPLWTGGAVTIDKDALAGPHKDQLPLADQVVSFP